MNTSDAAMHNTSVHKNGGPSNTPSPWFLATELPRTFLEASSLAWSWPCLTGMVSDQPKGDGHPVMVLPGFTAGDLSTSVLRRYLQSMNYKAVGWGLGRNTGRRLLTKKLRWRFYRMALKEKQPITLIGQSLGGVFARELAREFPEHVRQVITLGSPFGAVGPGSASPLVRQLFENMSDLSPEEIRERLENSDEHGPLKVPTTAIYSRSDGVVHWKVCREEASTHAENIEIVASHCGMSVNPTVFHVLGDRLAQPKGEWAPFERNKGWRSFVYPEPQT